MRMRVHDKEPKSLDHALHIALLAEANTEAKPVLVLEESQPRTNNYKARVVQNANKPAGNTPIASVESINDRCDKICEMLENIYKDKSPTNANTARKEGCDCNGGGSFDSGIECKHHLLQMWEPRTLCNLMP